MPFVADKIMSLLKHILKKGADIPDDDVEEDAHLKALKPAEEGGREKTIKSKIKTIA